MFGLKGIFDSDALIKGLVIQNNKESVDDKAIVECDGFIQYEALLKKDFACVLTSGEVDNIDYIPPTEMPICIADSEINYDDPEYPWDPPEPSKDIDKNDDETTYSALRWDENHVYGGTVGYYGFSYSICYMAVSVEAGTKVQLNILGNYGPVRWEIDNEYLETGSVTHKISKNSLRGEYTLSLDATGDVIITARDAFKYAVAIIGITSPKEYKYISPGFYALINGYYRRINMVTYYNSITPFIVHYMPSLGYPEYLLGGYPLWNACVKLTPSDYNLSEFSMSYFYSVYRQDETYYTTWKITCELDFELQDSVIVDDDDPDHPSAWATFIYTYKRTHEVIATDDPIHYVGEEIIPFSLEDEEDTLYFVAEDIGGGVWKWSANLTIDDGYVGYVTITFNTHPEVVPWYPFSYSSGEVVLDPDYESDRTVAIYYYNGSIPSYVTDQLVINPENGDTEYYLMTEYDNFRVVYNWFDIAYSGAISTYWYLPDETGWSGYVTSDAYYGSVYYFAGGYTKEKY